MTEYAIIETYPDLGFGPEVWTLNFTKESDARETLGQMRAMFPSGTYEAVGFEEQS